MGKEEEKDFTRGPGQPILFELALERGEDVHSWRWERSRLVSFSMKDKTNVVFPAGI